MLFLFLYLATTLDLVSFAVMLFLHNKIANNFILFSRLSFNQSAQSRSTTEKCLSLNAGLSKTTKAVEKAYHARLIFSGCVGAGLFV